MVANPEGRLQASKRTLFLVGCAVFCAQAFPSQAGATVIPTTQAVALDDHTVNLPADLGNSPVTVLILGFGRNSQEATTAWERPVRQQLAHPGGVNFYDMAMLAEVPGFIRPLVLRRIKHEVPDVLKPHFLPLMQDEAAWRSVCGYDSKAAEAAYLLVVDNHGAIRWSTHQPFTPATWQQLKDAVGDTARKER